jgi:hypothetical protein
VRERGEGREEGREGDLREGKRNLKISNLSKLSVEWCKLSCPISIH